MRLDKSCDHYLRRVLRKKAGDQAVLLDGQGRAWLCELEAKGEARYICDWPAIAPGPLHLTVALALCKGSRFEGAIEKLAELGVNRLVPLMTERTERKPPSEEKLNRWREIARAASALAGRLRPMVVDVPGELSDCSAHCVVCHPEGKSASQLLGSWSQPELTLVVGPEGGFSEEELSPFEQRLALGPHNLRVETAAVSAASLALAFAAHGM